MVEFKLGEDIDICIGYECKGLYEPYLYSSPNVSRLLHYEMCITIKPKNSNDIRIWIDKEQAKAIRKALKQLIKTFGGWKK